MAENNKNINVSNQQDTPVGNKKKVAKVAKPKKAAKVAKPKKAPKEHKLKTNKKNKQVDVSIIDKLVKDQNIQMNPQTSNQLDPKSVKSVKKKKVKVKKTRQPLALWKAKTLLSGFLLTGTALSITGAIIVTMNVIDLTFNLPIEKIKNRIILDNDRPIFRWNTNGWDNNNAEIMNSENFTSLTAEIAKSNSGDTSALKEDSPTIKFGRYLFLDFKNSPDLQNNFTVLIKGINNRGLKVQRYVYITVI